MSRLDNIASRSFHSIGNPITQTIASTLKMEPSFILSPAPAAGMSASAALNLVPFALGPGSAPYTSTSAPVSQYFQPRPCPANIPGVPAGAPFASFRGRQLVGQEISVPRGYKGVILSASARPEMGFEHRDAADAGPSVPRSQTRGARQPMTPASSSASIAAASVAGGDADEPEGVRRSPRKSTRVRGAGQVPLSRPKKREAPRRMEARKRIRLDSDDEEEDDSGVAARRIERDSTPVSSPAAGPQQTPRRGEVDAGHTVATPVKGQVPVIQIQGPTPRKELSTTPRRSLRRGDRAADFVPPGTVAEEHMEASSHEEDVAGPSPGAYIDQEGGLKVEDDGTADENDAAPPALARSDSSVIIPSPATEDDPPEFDVVLKPQPTVPSASVTSVDAVKTERTSSQEEASVSHDGPVRVLRPTSTFSSFMLWTADAPLAGFRQEQSHCPKQKKEEKPEKASVETEGEPPAETPAGENADAKLRQGWWQQGGGGEGGDEVVRALGEWLGLVETVGHVRIRSGKPANLGRSISLCTSTIPTTATLRQTERMGGDHCPCINI